VLLLLLLLAPFVIKAGATVTWTNKDDEPHTALSDVHPRMVDTIRVEPRAAGCRRTPTPAHRAGL
jgi:plastocyanin